jgi:RNase P subunit RPR2
MQGIRATLDTLTCNKCDRTDTQAINDIVTFATHHSKTNRTTYRVMVETTCQVCGAKHDYTKRHVKLNEVVSIDDSLVIPF